MDITQLQQLDYDFDLIYSVGNVLPHIPKNLQKELAEKIYNKLRSKGRFIFQTVNWNAVLEKGFQNFKVIEKKEKSLKFFREYKDITKERITFHLRLEKSGKIVFEEEQILYPLTSDEYKNIYNSAGFIFKDHFGDYGKNPFDDSSSPANILVFEKY